MQKIESWGEKMSIYFHLLFSWTKSKENLCLIMDASWKHLQADASNNPLPPTLNVLQAGTGSTGRMKLGLRRKRNCVWSGKLHILLSFEATLRSLSCSVSHLEEVMEHCQELASN